MGTIIQLSQSFGTFRFEIKKLKTILSGKVRADTSFLKKSGGILSGPEEAFSFRLATALKIEHSLKITVLNLLLSEHGKKMLHYSHLQYQARYHYLLYQ